MSMLTESALMTTEQMLSLPPNDCIERELINGQLKERPMTRRNPRHSRSETRFAQRLANWLDSQPEPRGEVHSGEAGIRLRRNPDTTVGIDVVYISAETAQGRPDGARLIDGVPILVVEILSPSDAQEDIADKVQVYLDCGVPLVWVADPIFRTVTVYRPGHEPELFNSTQQLHGGAHLPGFSVNVADCF